MGSGGSVAAYRSGYLPVERRDTEARLTSGELRGVASTNALELGINIGGPDACLMVGFPGTVTSTWQQAGRAGRSDRGSLAILIARDGPIDQYIMSHPDFLFGSPHEHAFIKHDNPYILLDHIRCAAAELPITGADAAMFGPALGAIAQLLADEGEMTERDGKFYWRLGTHPSHAVSLRAIISEGSFVVQDVDTGEAIACADEWGAYNLLHESAVYLLDGETYVVEKLDVEARIARVRKSSVGYFTLALQRQYGIPVDDAVEKRAWRGCALSLGDVEVHSVVTGFEKRTFWRHELVSGGALDLPDLSLETVALSSTP